MRRLLPTGLAIGLLLLSSGCAGWLLSNQITAVSRTFNAVEPALFVPQPDALARVRKIVVPDMRLKLIAGHGKHETMFRGTAAEGTGRVATDE